MKNSLGQALFSDKLLIHCQEIGSGLQEIQIFHKKTEEAWENVNTELEKKIKAHEALGRDDAGEWYGLDSFYNEKYVNIHRESVVITVYKYLESSLNTLCEKFSSYIESEIKLKDVAGRGIVRANKYLKKVVGLSFAQINDEIQFLANFNQLRNNIVHASGVVPKDSKNTLVNFIEKNDFLSGEAGKSIIINSKFIPYLIDILKKFFKKIANEIHTFLCKNTYSELKFDK